MSMTTQQQAKYRLTCALMPHDIVGSNGECPDHFVVVVSGPNSPTIQNTLHRKQGEADGDFWMRVIDAAQDLFRPVASRHHAYRPLYQSPYKINIRCDYGNNRDTAWDDGLQNFERVLWEIAEDPKDSLRSYAITLLERLYDHSVQGTVH